MTTERHYDIAVSSGNRTLVEVHDYPVTENCITFLFGESGIGKSIISKVLYGYATTTDLGITINNQPYAKHITDPWTESVKRNSFFVFQEPSSHLNPLLTIREQLDEGSLFGIDDRTILDRLWQTSTDERLENLLSVFPKAYRPSGGEKQRVLLAMAFKRIDAWISGQNTDDATYFVFDEPTGSLDNNYRNLFLQLLLGKFVARQFTAVIITHDYSIISEMYRNYRKLLPWIRFRELSRVRATQVDVHDFSPEEYLSWLAAPKKGSFATGNQPILSVAPHFSIFGRTCTIFSDPHHRKVTPLSIYPGEMVYLKAPSGIGKTTLAKIIMGIYKADRFSMILDGVKLDETTPQKHWPASIWGKRAGMVFQHADEALNLASTVRETFKGLPVSQKLPDSAIVKCLLDLFDRPVIEAILNKKVAYLSGGQKQRLNLLRTLVLDTRLIILDEPLNGLDFTSVKRVLELLNNKREHGSALLMISHNEEIFEHCIDERNICHLGASD